MDARDLIRMYEQGVRFECGCQERGLHPSIERALLDGSISTAELLYCPVHWAPMIGAPREPMPRVDPLVFE